MYTQVNFHLFKQLLQHGCQVQGTNMFYATCCFICAALLKIALPANDNLNKMQTLYSVEFWRKEGRNTGFPFLSVA